MKINLTFPVSVYTFRQLRKRKGSRATVDLQGRYSVFAVSVSARCGKGTYAQRLQVQRVIHCKNRRGEEIPASKNEEDAVGDVGAV